MSGSVVSHYCYLVQEAAGGGGTTSLPTPDATGSISMSATVGKVALCNTTTALTDTNPTGSQVIDLVGFGTTANGYEGTGPAPAPSNTTSVARINHAQDNNDNATDFATGSPNPLNSAVALPVELVSFAAGLENNQVVLRWSTATETDNAGFDVERKLLSEAGEFQRIAFIPGAGTSTSPKQYTYVDRSLASGTYGYRVKQIDRRGAFKYFPDAQVTVGLVPKELTLSQNYPNPFNPATNIDFSVPEDGRAIVRVHNLLGQVVATLFDSPVTAGSLMKVTFDASRLPSGVYFSRLDAGGHTLVKRMILVR